MKKFFSKISIFILLFTLVITSVNAKKVSIENLGKEVEKINKYAMDAYIIGSYVFTDAEGLTDEGLMLGATTIPNTNVKYSDELKNKMTINHIAREMDENGDYKEWTIKENVLGATKIEKSTTIDISYIDYDFIQEDTKTEVTSTIEGENKSALENTYGYKGNNENLNFKENAGNINVIGLVEYHPEVNEKYGSENGTGYYFAFVLKVANANSNTVIRAHLRNGETKEIPFDAFDKQSCSGDNEYCEIALLAAVDPKDDPKTLTLEVDLDGNFDKTSEYATMTYTIDYSGVTWPKESTPTVSLSKPSTEDEKTLTETWGYDREINKNLSLENGKLKGTLVLQTLGSDIAFGEENKTGFYFDFTFVTPDGVSKDNIKIARLESKNGAEKKVYKSTNFDDTNNLTILFQFSKETTACQPEQKENCKLYYSVDYDGNGTEYLPVVYEIDYSEVKFEKNSKVNISSVPVAEADDDNKTLWHNWIEKTGYSATFVSEKEHPHILKVNGFITISEEKNITGMESTYDYYLAFKITKDGEVSSETPTTVKFLPTGEGDGEDEKITSSDFNGKNSIYILKWINPNKINSKKQFTITVDFDDDAEAYAPYTLTIDWSELDFQKESNANIIFSVMDSAAIEADDKVKAELQSYGYDASTIENVKIHQNTSQEDQDPFNDGLTGSIKEQTLSTTAGFGSSQGYFVPIKIEFPKDQDLEAYKDKWTLILHDETGKDIKYSPKSEEYAQGWVMVLFKLDPDKDKIEYSIDFDGDDNKFIPSKYEINYKYADQDQDNLDFIALNNVKLTYKIYNENKWETKEEDKIIYEGEELGNSLEAYNSDYRKFDKWYDSKSQPVETTRKLQEHENLELTAHWNIDADTFVTEVVGSIEDSEERYALEKENQNITVNIAKPKVLLSELGNTNIPGAIAYALESEEIEEIDLTISDGSTVQFTKDYSAEGATLKDKIIAGAKTAFNTELENHESTATMDQLAFAKKEFNIKIADVADTINLVKADGSSINDDNDKTYNFNFAAPFVVVKEDGNLGAKTIESALASEDNYSTIYIDGNISLNETLNIDAKTDVTIKPVEDATEVSLASEPSTTLTSNSREYAIDVKSGNVTFENLKITGGKDAQIRLEDKTNVTLKNVDVSGEIEPSIDGAEDDMHASIIVKGTLNVDGIINNNENYQRPTIALITSYSHPSLGSDGGVVETDKKNVATNGKVNVKNMTKNTRFNIIKKEVKTNIDSIVESYYGEFYYTKDSNSKIYVAAIMDTTKEPSPYDYIKMYYYGENLDFSKLGYVKGETTAGDGSENVFVNFTRTDTNAEIIGNELAQNVLKEHDTTMIMVNYGPKPVAALTYTSGNGLDTTGNNLSGTLTTEDGNTNYVIPITLTSEKFNSETVLEVINPNKETKTYKYSESSDDGIMMTSTTKPMKLELEAIKSSNITEGNNKVYTLKLYVDGKTEGKEPEVYIIDYNNVNTLEELINNAADRTQAASSLTVRKDNMIKNLAEKFTFKYDKEKDLTLYNEGENDVEYTFRYNKVNSAHKGPIIIAVRNPKETDASDCKGEICRPKINNWTFDNFFKQVSKGYHEISLLQDVMGDTETIPAISKVKKIETTDPNYLEKEYNTYQVTLNKNKLNNWLDNAYLSSTTYTDSEQLNSESGTTDDENVIVEVVLDKNNEYLVSIKTTTDFKITSSINSHEYSNNRINVQFEDINSTTIAEPIEFLSNNGQQVTLDEIKTFYENSKVWHKAHTGAEIYEG